jgi:carboxyl-terminal processing protease
MQQTCRPASGLPRNAYLTRIFISYLTPIFISACSIVDPYNMIGRQMGEAAALPTEFVPSPPPATLRQEDRRRAFDFVWRTINDRYYDAKLNGVDWNAVAERYRPLAFAAADDDAFWDTLDRMAGELKDAHTRVESPRRVALRNRDESVTLGFSFITADGKLAIATVNPESDAWWAGVRPGMTLVNIGTEPAAVAYEKLTSETRLDSTDRSRHLRALHRLVTGDPGSSASFTFERADGSRFDATLTRRRIVTRPLETHRVLPSGYGYIRFNEWTLSVTARAIDGLDALKGTPGLVIDLRGNPGGAMYAVNQMLERFFPSRTEVGRVLTRSGKPVTLFMGTLEVIKLSQVVPGSQDAYKGPVAILVNSGSASGSELFAGAMQSTGRAEVIGQTSCGCLLAFLGYARVPGGAELAYSEVGFVLGNGKRIEGEGVIPDRAVPVTLPDLQMNRDRTLEEAQALLATLKPWDK